MTALKDRKSFIQAIRNAKRVASGKRAATACTSCRKSRVRCDDNRPCLRCAKQGLADSCIFEAVQESEEGASKKHSLDSSDEHIQDGVDSPRKRRGGPEQAVKIEACSLPSISSLSSQIFKDSESDRDSTKTHSINKHDQTDPNNMGIRRAEWPPPSHFRAASDPSPLLWSVPLLQSPSSMHPATNSSQQQPLDRHCGLKPPPAMRAPGDPNAPAPPPHPQSTLLPPSPWQPSPAALSLWRAGGAGSTPPAARDLLLPALLGLDSPVAAAAAAAAAAASWSPASGSPAAWQDRPRPRLPDLARDSDCPQWLRPLDPRAPRRPSSSDPVAPAAEAAGPGGAGEASWFGGRGPDELGARAGPLVGPGPAGLWHQPANPSRRGEPGPQGPAAGDPRRGWH